MSFTSRILIASFLATSSIVAYCQSTITPLPQMKEWFLTTGNWQQDPALYVLEVGSGPETIIMIHGGWGAEHSGMFDVVKGLDSRYRFIFYDQRGSLRSPFPDSLISFQNHINDLEQLRKELKLDKLNIVAHSMGAILASAYAQQHPDNIKQITLLSPALLKEPLPQEDKALQHQEYLASQEFLKRPEVTKELERFTLNRQTPPLTSQEETARFKISFGARMLYDIRQWPALGGGKVFYNPAIYALTERTYPAKGWDFIGEFKNRSYPVNILAGDHDFLDFGSQLIRKWTNGISHVNVVVLKNAGHIPWIDQPEIFKRELTRCLNK